VSERGIEANPEKVMAITKMGPIHNVKGVQRLTGCLATLSRFISQQHYFTDHEAIVCDISGIWVQDTLGLV
jgi:hypothetical protein